MTRPGSRSECRWWTSNPSSASRSKNSARLPAPAAAVRTERRSVSRTGWACPCRAPSPPPRSWVVSPALQRRSRLGCHGAQKLTAPERRVT